MIRITGDTHRDLSRFPDHWSEGDKLIITGDFGFVMFGEQPGEYSDKPALDILAQKPYEILFIDGNHEGFDFLVTYPEEQRYGGPVRRIRDNIFWLQRGRIYTIEGKTFFTLGGAYSMDKPRRLAWAARNEGRKIWFPQELPSALEYQTAWTQLHRAGMQVDYILTHTAPQSFIEYVIGEKPDSKDEDLTEFLDDIYRDVSFKKWFFGHFHTDKCLLGKLYACLTEVHELD